MRRIRRSLVFDGRAAEFESEIPFVLLVDALDPYLASQNARRFGVLSAEQRAELGAVFPAFGELGGSVVQAVQNERYRAHRAVRALVELLGSERACVLAWTTCTGPIRHRSSCSPTCFGGHRRAAC